MRGRRREGGRKKREEEEVGRFEGRVKGLLEFDHEYVSVLHSHAHAVVTQQYQFRIS